MAKGLIYGRMDVALADTFLEEKDAILKKLPSDLDVVFSSPSTRCTQLAAQLTENYKIDDRLYEVNFGNWEGKTWDTLDQEESALWMQDFVNVAPPDGESMMQMQQRVMHFWDELLQQSPANAAVVTHGGVIRILLATIQHVPLKLSFDFKIGYSAVFVVRPHLADKNRIWEL